MTSPGHMTGGLPPGASPADDDADDDDDGGGGEMGVFRCPKQPLCASSMLDASAGT